jgi:hypothetical protein
MENIEYHEIHIEAHIDCNSRIGNMYKKIDDKQYKPLQKIYDNPEFSNFYMYDYHCFKWNIVCQKGETINLMYIDALGQRYKKKIICNKSNINYLLHLKENWKTQQVTYELTKN